MSINTIIQNMAQVLTNTAQFSTVEAEKQTIGQLPLAPGQPVQAEVLANLPNNRFLARIAGELFNMELPIIVQPGETLELTYVSAEPRPTFSLSLSGNSATPVQISDTSKWLNQLSQNALPEEETTVLPRKSIILDGPPDDTGALAGRLQETLTRSGVFYESHLMQCFLGERQIRDILKEPQSKLADTAKASREAKTPVNGTAVEGEEIASRLVEGETSGKTAASAGRPGSDSAVHPSTTGIIREQLQTLSTGIFAWHGQVWPDQQMDWTVCERESQKGETDGKEWETTLNLDLPNMGGISSILRLGRDGLHLKIKADNTSSADFMEREKESLVQAMANAGLALVEMVVEHE